MFEVAVPESYVPVARIVVTDCAVESVVMYAHIKLTATLSLTVKLRTTFRLLESDIVAEVNEGGVMSGVTLDGLVRVTE